MRPRAHTIVLALCVAGCIVACATIKAASEHGTQLAIGGGVGLAAGIATGGTALLPLVAAAVASAVATIFSTPPCPPQSVTNINGPDAHVTVRGALGQETLGMPMWFWIAVGAVAALAVRNRHWIPFFFSSQAKGYRLKLLIHFILGGKPPTIPPQFTDLAKE